MSVYADTFEDDSERVVFDLGDLMNPKRNPVTAAGTPHDPEMTLEQIDELLASDAAEDD